nr:uncharacterized protein LOC103419310 isoform X2 [Malus domestica]
MKRNNNKDCRSGSCKGKNLLLRSRWVPLRETVASLCLHVIRLEWYFVQNTQIRDRSERKKSQLKIHWTESMAHLKSRDLLILKLAVRPDIEEFAYKNVNTSTNSRCYFLS